MITQPRGPLYQDNAVLSTPTPGPTLDLDQVRAWIETMYPDLGTGELLVVSSKGNWSGRAFPRTDLDSLLRYVAQQDQQGREGIYLRVTSVSQPPPGGKRGSEDDAVHLYGLWADLDLDGPAHKGEGYPPDEATALSIIDKAGLLAPTLIHNSGWGRYAYWLLDQPASAQGYKDLVTRWGNQLLWAAKELGWNLDNVFELARVMRLPGTLNRKIDAQPQQCQVMNSGSGIRYTAPQLLAAVQEAEQLKPPPPVPVSPAPLNLSSNGQRNQLNGEVRVGDDFNLNGPSFEEILVGARFTHHSDRGEESFWTRPDKNPRDGHSVTLNYQGSGKLYNFSSNTPRLPVREPIDKFGFLAHWEFGGDFHAATKYLSSARGGRYGTQRPEPELAQPWEPPRAEDGANPPSADEPDREEGSVPPPRKPSRAPDPGTFFTDANMGQLIAEDVLGSDYVWCKSLGWLKWNGNRWAEITDETVAEPVRQWSLERFAEAIKAGHTDRADPIFKGWQSFCDLVPQSHAIKFARGICERTASEFDSHPDLLNTPGGVVDLRTGDVKPHDPDLLLTKITKGSYRRGFHHPDWDQALTALPAPERNWLQRRVGQGVTGHPTPDGIMPVLQGSGENGKSLIMTEGVVPAFGDYAEPASAKLIAAFKSKSDHSTEMADLRGKRLLVSEEIAEDQALDMTSIKRIMDVGVLKARYVYRNNMTFTASHSMFATSNPIPVVKETDHGTWRRLGLLKFPFTYRKDPADITQPSDRLGDPELKIRIRTNTGNVYDAIVTWAVEGAIQYYRDPGGSMAITQAMSTDTLEWRTSSDRIMGWWQERLISAKGHSILCDEMLTEFNKWLGENGHNQWSKEAFTPKFAQHQMTVSNGVSQERTMRMGVVSRVPGSWHSRELRKQERVWLGVRFREEGDTYSDQSPDDEAGGNGHNLTESNPIVKVAEVADPSETFLYTPAYEKSLKRSATSASDLEEGAGTMNVIDVSCWAPGCSSSPRNGCLTCASHMHLEMEAIRNGEGS